MKQQISYVTKNGALLSAAILALSICVSAQTSTRSTLRLGNAVIVIPAPNGFEEATSKFEDIKNRFARTEAPNNDMLLVHLLSTDCDKLSRGEAASFDFYTKISILRSIREKDYSPAMFADLVVAFRQSGAQVLDVNGPTMKQMIKHLDESLTGLNKQKTQVDFSQPINLGEIDTRPNAYAVLLMMNFKTKSEDTELNIPVVGGLAYVRVRQRLLYVFTYRKYKSKEDIDVLRGFTTRWIGQILASN